MAKAYWVSTYFSVSNPEALAEYAKLAGPALAAAGAKFLARGNAVKAYEKGVIQRVVVIEFDSVAQAVAAHDGPGYQAALKALGDGATSASSKAWASVLRKSGRPAGRRSAAPC
jgi:uncharacterized protein (DUF1330 family)